MTKFDTIDGVDVYVENVTGHDEVSELHFYSVDEDGSRNYFKAKMKYTYVDDTNILAAVEMLAILKRELKAEIVNER